LSVSKKEDADREHSQNLHYINKEYGRESERVNLSVTFVHSFVSRINPITVNGSDTAICQNKHRSVPPEPIFLVK
jgi:hypothetical protein